MTFINTNNTITTKVLSLPEHPQETIEIRFRHATMEDLEKIATLESLCFPKAEAASKESFSSRLKAYPNHFLLGETANKIICNINGLVTNEKDLKDEMYENTSYHQEKGNWQMIFGVETHPSYQKLGLASFTMKHFIKQAQEENRLGIVLTCKKELLPFYKRFGFIDEGVSSSEHGGVIWHQMRLFL